MSERGVWLDNVELYLSQISPEFAVFVKIGLGIKVKPYIQDFGNSYMNEIFPWSTLLMNRGGGVLVKFGFSQIV